MPVKLLPTSTIKANLGIEPNGRIQKFFTQTCAIHMDKYVPFNNGDLARYRLEGNKIIYDQPYAHYMYKGEVMGTNIPIKEDGIVVGWFSPKGKKKHYTGKAINYSNSISKGHKFAGKYWDKRMWSAEKEQVKKEVQDQIKHGG